MSNVYQFPGPDDEVTDAACEWLARLERGLSEREERELRDWLDANPKHGPALVEIAGFWDRMDALSRLADLFPRPVVRPGRRPGLILAFAAVALAFAVGWLLTSEMAVDRFAGAVPQGTRPDYMQVIETAIGEHSTMRLPDGSELTLNTNSRVRAEFSEHARVLRLEQGEMYVRVAHDAARPLSVWAGDRVVRAVGTAFNVEIKEDERVEVIVTEGKVLIGVTAAKAQAQKAAASTEQRDTAVTAGQRILLSHEAPAVDEIAADQIDVRLSWRSGNLVFRGEPLAQALGEVERYTRVTFVIQDEALKTVRVAGLFKAGDVEGLLATLRKNFNIAYERVDERTIVLKSE